MPQEDGIGHLTDDTIQGVIMVSGTWQWWMSWLFL
jgi:hypothetical protein